MSLTRNLDLAIENVGVSGDFYVMAVLYMKGGGTFQPNAEVDYMAVSSDITFGQGQVKLDLELYRLP